VRRCFPATVSGLAIVGVALAACSNGAGPASVAVKLVVDGKAQPTENKVACVTAHNMVLATIGNDQDDIDVTLSAGDTPALQELSLGKIDGLSLTYNESNPGPKPTVTKAGSNYRIVGTATSLDPAGPGTVSKPFEMEFTCPPKR
jgi:ipoprotein LpqH